MRKLVLFGILAATFIIVGCSATGDSPVLPSQAEQAKSATLGSMASKQLWGIWQVTIDPAKETVEIVPLRGTEFTCDVVAFLQPPAGKLSNLKIVIADVSEFATDGRIKVDVSLTHPFPGLDMYTGFDVYGVFVHKGGKTFSYADNMVSITDGVDGAILENADGYTCWMSPAGFPSDGSIFRFVPGKLGTAEFPGAEAADANGFKYFADGLEKDADPSGFFYNKIFFDVRGMFSPGSMNTREYVLRFPMVGGGPLLQFQYAVTANWEPADNSLSGDPYYLDVPGDFPTSANAREAVHIDATDNSTTWYVDDNHRGGDIKLDLEIFDWDGLEGIGPIYVAGTGDLVPGGSAMFDPASLTWSPGGFNSSVTSVEITGAMPSGLSNQEVLVVVEANPPASYDQGIGQPPPIELAMVGAYQRFAIHIDDKQPEQLMASGKATIEPYFDGFGPAGTSADPLPTEWYLTLDASGSTGPIAQYLWDMDEDDIYDDASGKVVSAGFSAIGTHSVSLKITDGVGGEATYDLPETYEVVKGTYVVDGFSSVSDGSRANPYASIPAALAVAGTNAYILCRGDNGGGGQNVYDDDLTLGDANSGTRIQGYYGDYTTDKPPMQTGFVRIEGDNITFDGFEVTGPSDTYYTPYGHYTKLGTDNADDALLQHLYIHDLQSVHGNTKAILCWGGGSLTVRNVIEVDLHCSYQKNQIHFGDPTISFENCTFDQLGTDTWGQGFYRSGGTGNMTNTVWTDVLAGFSYIRAAGGVINLDYSCICDTPVPPDGGNYFEGMSPGPNCILSDPEYVDPMGDHHLKTDSPAIDTGDPAITDFDGTASDMGCYGGLLGDWDFEK